MADLHGAVLRALEDQLPQPVERIDTHGAHVLLAGERAYKLKRAVRFSFFDFATPEKRRGALETELRLNRRTAADLYERVASINRAADGRLALDGPGEPVEWVLVMRRFPDEARLDRVAERGELDRGLAERLAEAIADLHERAEIRRDKGGATAMARVLQGNAEEIGQLAGAVFDRAEAARFIAAAELELAAVAALLDERRAAGFVRHCHGDLHLANAVLLERGPVPFDCLEFDEDLACIDLVYDIAFMVMDLLRRGRRAAAQQVLQGWLERTEDDAGQRLMPLCIAARAAVRAKVGGLAGELAEDSAKREESAVEARGYLHLAGEALEPVPPRLVAIGGLSGTGKTTLARALAPRLGAMPGAVLLRSDILRKRLFGVPVDQRLPPEAYTAPASRRVFARLAERAGVLLEAGRSVIADGVYGRPEERDAIERVAQNLGVPFTGIWLEAGLDTLVERVTDRSADASDADAKVVRRQQDYALGAIAWERLDAGGEPEAVARRAAGLLGVDRRRQALLASPARG